MDELRFGTAGIPISTKKAGTTEGIKRVRELGLSCMELEFVRGVNLTEESAALAKKAAKENDVALSVHAPYYINLNSAEDKKREESIERILKSARIGFLAGASSLTFHAAYYMGKDREETYLIVKKALSEIVSILGKEGNTISVRPELTGKESQFGDLKELIRLSQDIEGVMPCIDFAHYFARYNGRYNTASDFSKILEEIEKSLGKESLNNMHIHMSGIEHGEKGEKKHLVLGESEFNYRAVLMACKEFKIGGIVICESPNIEEDALVLKKAYG